MNIWMWKMFLASLAGSLAALFWPVAISVWRVEMAKYHASLAQNSPSGAARGAGANANRHPPRIVRWIELLFNLVIVPFVRIGMRWLRFILLALFIAGIASAVGFAGFLKGPDEQKKLADLGSLAFFMAFNYGFMASSVIEEALRNPRLSQ